MECRMCECVLETVPTRDPTMGTRSVFGSADSCSGLGRSPLTHPRGSVPDATRLREYASDFRPLLWAASQNG